MASLRIHIHFLPLLFAGLLALSPAKGQVAGRGGQPAVPPKAEADAPFDMTGYWVSVITQNWRYRMVVPPRGDYMGIPLSVAAKQVADAWDPAKDEAAGEQCKGYSAPAIMTNPEHLHITWQDDQTLRMDVDAGTQTRLFHFGNWKSAGAAASWQGDSLASWSPRAGLAFVSSPKARSLKVTTTNMRPGYLRKNGVPFGAGATLTEYFDVFQEPEGETWMTVTMLVRDPVYLENPLIWSAQFKKQSDASGWDPEPCSTKW
ncbi:MAG: hypothetical protein M3O20_15400 [Acidobacteriota bacterium]|nr:hypothetical protein [Acidobacteriota bacterium]